MTSQLEQLLTCCICLDRFRNPKLLPCQHSVCMEPCMEGLVDYVRRQVKCPECRAEHRIPYNGVQGYPSNVTLQRFLEAHIEITGEQPDPHTGQIMERCAVCNEKNYLTTCSHCEKKICDDCKAAHTDILKREIGRINNQVKRAMNRLKDQQIGITRTIKTLKSNSESVMGEIDSIERRLLKAVRDRCNFLKNEADNHYNSELRNLSFTKDGLEQEVLNAESNSELADKHMNDNVQWDDCELMDAKEIFLRTMEFIRGFDYDSGEFNRKARFNSPDDIKKIISQISGIGEFVINNSKQPLESYSTTSLSGGLMKSKSDHRLAAQFREQDDNIYTTGRSTSPCYRRKFGERPIYNENTEDSISDVGRKRFRSRFIRRDDEDDKPSRYDEDAPKPRQRVIDTEDVSRGPLSGITRMFDSPRVMQRLQEKDLMANKKKEEIANKTPTPITTQSKSYSSVPQRKTHRQLSEDEIDKIKKQNKSESSLPSTSTSTPTPKPTYSRTNSVKENNDQTNRSITDRNYTTPRTSTHSSSVLDDDTSRTRDYNTNRVDNNTSNSVPSRKTSMDVGPSITQRTVAYSRSSSTSSIGESSHVSNSRPPKPLDTNSIERKLSRSNSNDSNRSFDGTTTSSRGATGAAFSTDEIKSRFQPKSTANRNTNGSNRFQSRFLGRAGTPSAEASRGSGNEDDDDDDESSEETDSEETEESSEEEEEEKINYGRSTNALNGRSSQARDATTLPNYNNTTTMPSSDSGYNSKYSSSGNSNNNVNSRYGISSTTNETKGYQRPSGVDNSKYNNKEKEENFETKYPYAIGQGSSRAKFEELKEKRQRLARSKSSAGVEDDDSVKTEPDSSYRSRYSKDKDSNKSTVSSSTNADDSSQLSNWARYLKNKYGNRSGASSSSGSSGLANSSSLLSRSRSSHLLGLAKEDSSEDDSKNVAATPTTRAAGILGPTPFGSIHRNQYLQKQRTQLKIGSRGSEAGNFTWPRGIAIGPDNIIVVADSSNHRVQVFDQHGVYKKEFGKYGSGNCQFDCLAGVAVNRIGQFIIADRYNHRIQIFDQSGSFLRSFGSQGNSDGKFSYPWGIATDSLGYIYVCDKENHRVQVFQSDGSFAGKFGTMGNKPGQLEHPHYIAVSSTNQVIVSDSNNHRVQMFDVNGKVIASFGSEGSGEGQFKFPRGVAVDEQNYIFVADSGNNRIQIFNSDGTFLRSFGCWGSADGEFKGLEGVAVTQKGNILVCDRENHRVQMF